MKEAGVAGSEERGGGQPESVPRYKTAVIIWLAIYPALTLTLALLGGVLAPLPLFLRTLVLTGLLVPMMVYVLVPAVTRLLAGWLRAPHTPERL
jgi:antibiotic biosynthesis monooxygenase (ABM) superfamily enzyme